jgi:hypothetical protein
MYLTPTLELRNIGVDTNVYNENAPDPTKDFVLTAVPIVVAVVGPPRASLGIRSETQFAYFANQVSERSVNEDLTVSARGRFGRFSPSAEYSYLNTRERLSFEIDARARHVENRGTVGVAFALTPKISVDTHGEFWRLEFDGDEVFDSYGLAAELNRESVTLGGGMTYRATPLTSLVVSGDASTIRFDEASFRDTDTRQLLFGVELNPRALISGSGRVGYQNFRPLNAAVPAFDGVVGAATLSYRLRPTTSIGFTFDRRTDFSYAILEPYYVREGYGLSVLRRLPAQWDIALSATRTSHRYLRLLRPEDDNVQGHRERLVDLGATLGYDIGPRTRTTVGLAYQIRYSDFDVRGYHGARLGASVVYGF